MSILAVIPARGGSKGIPRKNVRLMAGKPLISYVITEARKSKYITDVVVTSDDEEIKLISADYGAEIIERPKELAEDHVTLDPVIYDAVCQMEMRHKTTYETIVTIQPTSPLLSVMTLDAALELSFNEAYDTVISGVNDPHLSWGITDEKYVPKYEKRLNRQYLPKDLRETGAFVISERRYVTEQGRFGEKIAIYEMPENEAVDIDTPRDWWIAENEINKKNILVRVEGYSEIGLGHIYRGIQLANGFIDHNVGFAISDKSDIGKQKLAQSNFKYKIVNSDDEFLDLIDELQVDIVVNDILNTDAEYIKRLKKKGVRVVNFEDTGEGAESADAVINALYETNEVIDRHYFGSNYYLIRDEFALTKPMLFRNECNEILVIFGGTDPNNLTKKTVIGLMELSREIDFHVTVILGMGYKDISGIRNLLDGCDDRFTVLYDVKMMARYMRAADLAISSQGRTMLELASMGVPTILMSQNDREELHKFGTLQNGFVNLGSGAEVDEEMLFQTMKWLVLSPKIRRNMHDQMLNIDLKNGMKKVRPIILGDV